MTKLNISSKLLFSLIFLFIVLTNLNAVTHIITNSGFSFSPAVININLGDTVNFVLEPMHNAVEVSEATWSANGNTSNGGFSIPFGGGILVPDQAKIYYYVCSPHASIGMKGIIRVNNPAPEILSITPELGPVGTIVTIIGNGFSNIPSENIVRLGTGNLTLLSASPTQLVCVVPENATTGEVKVFVNGIVSSPPYRTFTVLPNGFVYLPSINQIDKVQDIISIDFEGDTYDDVVIVGSVIGRDRPPKVFPTLLKRMASSKTESFSVTTIPDFDLDSNFSVIATNKYPDTRACDYVSIMVKSKNRKYGSDISLMILKVVGNSTGDFKFYRTVKASSYGQMPSATYVCDITGEDSVDVIFAYESLDGMPAYIHIIKNIPGGGFSDPPYTDEGIIVPIGGTRCEDIETQDIDGDGVSDIVCATDNGIYVIKNNVSSFSISQIIDDEHPYIDIEVCDIDGDRRPDIIALRNDIGLLNVCLADSTNAGQFFSPEIVGDNIAIGRNTINIGDVDGDSRCDVVCRSGIPGRSLSMFLIHSVIPGAGVVSARIDIQGCDNDSFLFSVGNFDSDNHCDFTIYGCSSTVVNPPIVSNISPNVGIAGSILSIGGKNLDNISSVRVGDNECDLFGSGSSSGFKVILPYNARVKDSVNIFDITSIVSDNGVCHVLKNITVSPVYLFNVPQVSNLETVFLQAGDIDGDGIYEATSYKIKDKNKYKNGHVILLKAIGDEEEGTSERCITTTFPEDDRNFDGMVVADFDNDGKSEFVVFFAGSDRKSGSIIYLDREGNEVLRGIDKKDIRRGMVIARVATGDVDGDGFFDITYITSRDNVDSIITLLNDPVNPGNFSSEIATATSENIKDIKMVRRPGSSFYDIFCITDDGIIGYMVEGGRHTPIMGKHLIRETSGPRSLAIGDLDGDGRLDMVVADDDSSIITVCVNNGDGTYNSFSIRDTNYSSSTNQRRQLLLMDFDIDGKLDIGINEPGISMKSNPDVYVWKVKYNVTPEPGSPLMFEDEIILIPDLSSFDNQVASGDVDGDGISDLLVCGVSSSTIYPPIINDLSPRRRISIGKPMKVIGKNLSTVNNLAICSPCFGPIAFHTPADTELVFIIPPVPGEKFIKLSNSIGVSSFVYPITVLERPDMFVSLAPDSLVLTEPNGKFKNPVKRGKGLYPNWTNLLEEVVVQGGFQPGASESDSAGGMRIGISHIFNVSSMNWKPVKDSAKVRAWVRVGNWDVKKAQGLRWKAIQKTLKNNNYEHYGIARGLDSTGSPGDPKRKKLKGELKILDPKKTSNKLFAELVALKFNIAASQLGKTPVGFGELVYDNDSSRFDEMSILEISRRADTAMTYFTDPVFNDGDDHDGINPLYEELYHVIYQINRAFVGPLDTATFEIGRSLTVNGVVDLSTVPYLKMPVFFRPTILFPTTLLTESLEDDEDMEDVESIPTVVKLYQNYPNPFNPTTTISFGLKENSKVSLKVYNTLGQLVAVLVNNVEMNSGNHTVEFDAGKLSSGVYVYRLSVEELSDNGSGLSKIYTEQRKMLLLK